MDVRVGLQRKLSAKELMLLNCGVEEDSYESLLDCKEILPVHPKGDQSWIFTGRAEAETPILWPPDSKSWLICKDSDAGKDWRREEKGTTADETVGWHHWLDGHEYEQALGVGDGQGSLSCFSPWGCKESYATELLNWLTGQYPQEEEMAAHSNILAWIIPWTEESVRLLSMGSQIRHDWSDLACMPYLCIGIF